jgi:hypothetical protein
MEAVRKVDPAHVLFIEGNTYARDFKGFDPTWKNVVYTNHDYAAPGSISGGPYPGETGGRHYDSKTVEADFLTKSQFMIDNGLPIWVGEFGPVYTGDAQKDEMRYQLLKDQLAIYDKRGASWCIWLYRDLGLQAIVSQPETTAWMQRIKPMLDKKQRLGSDAWGSTDAGVREITEPIDAMLTREFPDYDPYPNGAKREARLLVRHILIAEALLSEYGKAFEGLSDDQVVALGKSFSLDQARRRTRLEAILSGKER